MAVPCAPVDCGCKSASTTVARASLGVSLTLNAELCEILSAAVDLTPHITKLSDAPVNGGARGDIWTAYYGDVKVGLKTMRPLMPSSAQGQQKHLLAELKSLTRLNHPNVLELLGVYAHLFPHSFGLAIVSPWMELGDMQQYLRLNPDKADRFSLIMDAARGMHYLHTRDPPVVHGDLRSRNILINAMGRACLADFDLSRVMDNGEERDSSGSLTPYGSPRWMSPERILPEAYGLTPLTSFTPAADTYAFGMIIYATFTGAVPFADLTSTSAVILAVLCGKRPLHPGNEASARGLCDVRYPSCTLLSISCVTFDTIDSRSIRYSCKIIFGLFIRLHTRQYELWFDLIPVVLISILFRLNFTNSKRRTRTTLLARLAIQARPPRLPRPVYRDQAVGIVCQRHRRRRYCQPVDLEIVAGMVGASHLPLPAFSTLSSASPNAGLNVQYACGMFAYEFGACRWSAVPNKQNRY